MELHEFKQSLYFPQRLKEPLQYIFTSTKAKSLKQSLLRFRIQKEKYKYPLCQDLHELYTKELSSNSNLFLSKLIQTASKSQPKLKIENSAGFHKNVGLFSKLSS